MSESSSEGFTPPLEEGLGQRSGRQQDRGLGIELRSLPGFGSDTMADDYSAKDVVKDVGGNGAEENEEARPQWKNRTEFVLTLVGYAVGIGNVWRFPYLCFENGGAVFLVPYLCVLIFLGIPIFALEIAVGQALRKGSIEAWNIISPYMGGVGQAGVIVTFVVQLYYNVIIAWALLYMGYSFQSPLPWTETYKTTAANVTETTMDSTIFFEDVALQISDNINDAGYIPWRLWLCLTVAWIIIYLIVWKGIESSGKVVYFTATFPYFIILTMIIRGCTLDGAGRGLAFYLIPDPSALLNGRVWVKAGEQVFYSLGCGWGSLVTFGSFNTKNHDFVSDSYLVPLINCGTSFLAGLAVFSTAGYISKQSGVPVADLQLGGVGLAFEAYPTALAQMGGSNFFSIMFFFMLLLLGIDSQFAMTETVITAIVDSKVLPRELAQKHELEGRNKWKLTATVCLLSYFIGFIFVTNAGIYWVNVVDGLSAGPTLMAIGGMEAFAVSYVWGVDRFLDEAKAMVGPDVVAYYPRTWSYFRFCWAYASPVLLLTLFITTFVLYFTEYSSYSSYVCHDTESDDCPDAQWVRLLPPLPLPSQSTTSITGFHRARDTRAHFP